MRMWLTMLAQHVHGGSDAGADVFTRFGLAVWHVFLMAAPYLLLGFLLAGLAHVLLPTRRARQWLGKPGWRGIVRAAMLGVPLPLCSCSVIPVATALRKQGASKGATASFLISTPETGVDSIVLTYGLLDGVITVFRPIAAFLSGVVGGFAVQAVSREHYHTDGHGHYSCSCESDQAPGPGHEALAEEEATGNGQQATEEREEIAGNNTESGDCYGTADQASARGDCGCEAEATTGHILGSSCCGNGEPAEHAHDASCCDNGEPKEDCCSAVAVKAVVAPEAWFVRALRFSFVTVARDIVWALLIGFAAAGLMEALLPPNFFERYLGNELLAIAVMLVVGLPMYVCASASTPIAAAMIAMGLSPGAALVFLMAGPATNITTMIAVKQQMGWRALAAYLASVAFMAVAAGLALNGVYHLFFAGHWQMRMANVGETILPAWLSYGSAGVIVTALAFAAGHKLRARFTRHTTPD